MPTVQINVTGGSYRHRSLPLSAQTTRNLYPQIQQNPRSKSPYVLQSFPRKKLWATQAGGADRGMFVHRNKLYKVTGSNLYEVDSFGNHTSLGTITGTGRCHFAPIGTNIILETGQKGSTIRWQWDGSTLAQITDADLEAGTGITHLNSQIIYGGTGGRFGVSDPGNATSIQALNYATAESQADDLVRPYAFNQIVYMFGENTIEPWWNSGQGNPPFDRVEGGILQVGLEAFHSVANDDGNLYFLATDYQVYTLRGSASAVLEPLLPEPIVREISGYTRKDDAIGYCMNYNGQWFYILTFPFDNKTWAYPMGGEWFELSSDANGGRDLSNSYVFFAGRHLVSDFGNGNIYELSDTTYTDNGEEVNCIRDTGPIHGGLFDAPGKRLEMNRFELIMETGVGTLSGQGAEPVVMLSYSDDGGRTFSTQDWGRIGRLREFIYKVEFFALGSFYERIMRIEVSDPVFISIHYAAADLEVGI